MQASARTLTLADVVIPGTGVLRDAVLVTGFAFFTAVVAQIAIRLPTTTVPITGQTFAVLLTGAALGSKRGALSMLLYTLLGMFALPLFAPRFPSATADTANQVYSHFILPWSGTQGHVWDLSSGGYIVGFIFASYLVGLLAERGWDRRSTIPLAMLLGNIVLYVFGLAWLAYYIAHHAGVFNFFEGLYPGSSLLDKTLKGGLYPFIGGDAVKLLLATMVLPGAWQLANRFRGPGTPQQRWTRGD